MAHDDDRSAAHDDDVVEVRLPAKSAYVSLLRTTVATLGSRVDFTLDEIDDLRIAVDEASGLLLNLATPGSRLLCTFRLSGKELRVRVACSGISVPDGSSPSIPRDSFAWMVLTGLTDSVDTPRESDGSAVIELTKTATIAHQSTTEQP